MWLGQMSEIWILNGAVAVVGLNGMVIGTAVWYNGRKMWKMRSVNEKGCGYYRYFGWPVLPGE